MPQISLSGCNTVQTYWLKKDSSTWVLYSNSACSKPVANHTFESPYNQTTGYHFIVAEPEYAFLASAPVLWTTNSVPNIPSAAKHSSDWKEYAFKDENNFGHHSDKSCPFDLQVVDEEGAAWSIFGSIHDVDPTIAEKGDPDPGGGLVE